jgi:hypothetical protein
LRRRAFVGRQIGSRERTKRAHEASLVLGVERVNPASWRGDQPGRGDGCRRRVPNRHCTSNATGHRPKESRFELSGPMRVAAPGTQAVTPGPVRGIDGVVCCCSTPIRVTVDPWPLRSELRGARRSDAQSRLSCLQVGRSRLAPTPRADSIRRCSPESGQAPRCALVATSRWVATRGSRPAFVLARAWRRARLRGCVSRRCRGRRSDPRVRGERA